MIVQVGIMQVCGEAARGSETKPQTRRSAIHQQGGPEREQVLLHQTARAVRCAEGDFRIEAFFAASLKTSLVWDSSS